MSDIYPISLTRYNDLDEAGLIDTNQTYQIYSTEEDIAQELIRTRKALDIAINVLNRVKDVKYEEYIDEKLEQINEIIKGGDNE